MRLKMRLEDAMVYVLATVFIVTAIVRMRQECKKFFALTVQICEDKK